MCSHYEAVANAKAIKKAFAFVEVEDGQDLDYGNVRPTVEMPVLVGYPARVATARWGFSLPQGEGKRPKPVFNAKCEGVETSGFWKGHLAKDRVGVLFSRFMEGGTWITVPGGLGLFPGLWRREADGLYHAAFLTTAPNDFMRPLHHRMPRILQGDEMRAWLDPAADMAAVRHILRSSPEVELAVAEG